MTPEARRGHAAPAPGDAPMAALFRPVDIASLAAFRVLFGVLMTTSAIRFLANGWVHRFYIEPRVHLKYWGFSWIEAWPGSWMYVHFAVLAILAVMIALGLFYRVATVLFFLGFTYAQLVDVSLYLNHYYLITLLAFLLMFLPAHGAWSLDALRRPAVRRHSVPRIALLALQFQIAVVYTFAGLAKLGSDWLLDAQPLTIWLSARQELPVLGPLFSQPWAPHALSWAGFLFDSTIVVWLSRPRTRPFAFALVVLFHSLTHVLFTIGMFPAIMISVATVFFAPDWPRTAWRAIAAAVRPRSGALAATAAPSCPPPVAPWPPARRRLLVTALAAYALIQVALPLRSRLYDGNVLWHEQGMRFSWRVLAREKNGSVSYLVRSPSTGREWQVSPHDYLLDYQEREFSTQPDLIWQLAQHIAADFARRGHGPVEVRAEAWAALNARRAALLVDPSVDLTQVSDGLGPKSWISPQPGPAPRRPGLAWR